jgi:hypothetical protein
MTTDALRRAFDKPQGSLSALVGSTRGGASLGEPGGWPRPHWSRERAGPTGCPHRGRAGMRIIGLNVLSDN